MNVYSFASAVSSFQFFVFVMFLIKSEGYVYRSTAAHLLLILGSPDSAELSRMDYALLPAAPDATAPL